jgi:two-component system chemotaxis response regulator CheB
MISGSRIRILIVDDSAVMRSLLRSVVNTDSLMEVAGTAVDGQAALLAVQALAPDVVLLDVEMPVMDGLTTLKKLRGDGNRVPVIMCSSLTQRGARVTLEALAAGAADYVAKPAAQENRTAAVEALRSELIPKLHALAGARHVPLKMSPRPLPTISEMRVSPAVVAIGVSTGGPEALERILKSLPSTFPLPILVVQHMPELFTKLLADRLDHACALRVREAEEGATIEAGHIYIAKGEWHLEARASASNGKHVTLHLTRGPLENHCRPSVDVLFRSLAGIYGAGVLGAVLTGMGYDGLAGCRMLRQVGATVLAQDEASSVVWGMPGAVVNAGLAHRVLPLGEIARELVTLATRSSADAFATREAS